MCGSRSNVCLPSLLNPQTLDSPNPLFGVLCRQREPVEETSSSSMSPRPPLSATLVKCKHFSDGFKCVTCAACPSYWKLGSHLWWRSLSNTYYVGLLPPQLSLPARLGPSLPAFGASCCSPGQWVLSLMTMSHTSVLLTVPGEFRVGKSQKRNCHQKRSSSFQMLKMCGTTPQAHCESSPRAF